MNFPSWARNDGEKLANLILEELDKKGILRVDEIFDIYETCGFPVLRKTEGFAWGILNPKIERVKDEDNRLVFKLKE